MDNSIQNMSEAISKYGLLTVILAVVIVAFALLFVVFVKYINKSLGSIVKQNEEYFNLVTRPRQEPKILDTHLQINDMVGNQLRRLRDTTDADRAFIYMFHNTDHGIGGFPFLKASCYYEWTLATVKTLLGRQRDIPVFLLAPALSEIGRGKPFVVHDIVAQREKYPALAAYMEEVDSRSTVLYPLTSAKSGIIGFLGVDYTCMPIEENQTEVLINYVKESAHIIEAILDSVEGENIRETDSKSS